MDSQHHLSAATSAYNLVMNNLAGYKHLVESHRSALKGSLKILESCSGPSTLAAELLKHGSEVHALDKNTIALLMTKQKARGYESKLFLHFKDAEQGLSFEGESFDGVSSMLALPYMQNPIEYLLEHARVLKKNGIFVVSGLDKGFERKYESVLRSWKMEHERKGLLHELEEPWRIFEAATKDDVTKNISVWFSLEELVSIMQDSLGLNVLEAKGNPLYYGEGYFIAARK